MCGPALPLVGIALSAISTGVSMYGQSQQASAQQNQMNYEAAIQRNNMIAANNAANTARADGDQQSAQEAIQGKQLIARQRATFAQNGSLVDTGSALNITADSAEATKLNELTIKNNADRTAIGFENEGANFNAQSGLDTLAGQNAANAGTTGMFGTLVSGAGLVASKWYDFQKNFPGSGSPNYDSAYAAYGAYGDNTGGGGF